MGFPLLFLYCVLHNWMLYVFQKAAKVTVTAIIHCATEQQHHLERYYITQLCIPPITASACCAAFRLACVVITLVKNNEGAKCVDFIVNNVPHSLRRASKGFKCKPGSGHSAGCVHEQCGVWRHKRFWKTGKSGYNGYISHQCSVKPCTLMFT